MPIYHKAPPSVVGNHATSEIDNHTSEAAKVKRTREHAYFNSYDFDAIEVLPYDDEDEDDEGRGGHMVKTSNNLCKNSQQPMYGLSQKAHAQQSSQLRQHLPQPLKYAVSPTQQEALIHPKPTAKQPNGSLNGLKNSSNSDKFIVDSHPLPQHSHSNSHASSNVTKVGNKGKIPANKYSSYLQRFGVTLFGGGGGGGVNSNNATKSALSSSPHHQSSSSSSSSSTASTSTSLNAMVVDNDDEGNEDQINAGDHIKLSSPGSGLSSASASSPSSASSPTNSSSSKTRESKSSASSSCTTASCSAIAEDSLNCESCHRDTKAVNLDHNNVVPVALKDTTSTTPTLGSTPLTGPVAAVAATCNAAAVATVTAVSADGNFLLPRAMLKYQSTTNGICVNNNNNNHLAAVSSSVQVSSNNNSMSMATTAAAATTSNVTTAAEAAALTTTTSITGSTPASSTSATTTDNNTTTTNANRLKKHSTTSSSLSSLGSEEIVEIHHVGGDHTKDSNDFKVRPKLIGSKAPRRAASHQSHYSTDKSASSGYYSSNVCSTYSLEEHIYSEPTVELKEMPLDESLNAASHTATIGSNKPVEDTMPHQAAAANAAGCQSAASGADECATSVMRTLDYNRRYRYTDHNVNGVVQSSLSPAANLNSTKEFTENLRILETSIENLDRHLKSFPGVIAPSPEAIVTAYTHNSYQAEKHQHPQRASYSHLPTIREGYDVGASGPKRVWREDPNNDDSLMDIDLDSFLLDENKKEKNHRSHLATSKGIDNPSFLTEELEENHYKCAKYINSCPEDAYRVESDIIAPARSCRSDQSVATVSVDLYPKRYEDQLHFQNTRELLEDVRDKIRLLTLSTPDSLNERGKAMRPQHPCATTYLQQHQLALDEYIPKELHTMIGTLKRELELYLQRMNQHSELEIRQLCTGLVKNQHIVKMKNAFERRRSLTDISDQLSSYEALQGEMRAMCGGAGANCKSGPISIRQQVTTIKCSSDPNFKMKRKSLTEVFPMSECYIETLPMDSDIGHGHLPSGGSQLQRNLNFHQPTIQKFHGQCSDGSSSFDKSTQKDKTSGSAGISRSTSGHDSSESNDKDSILEWHRKKPSIWEMYYGTNRIQQSLLGCNGKNKGMMMVTGNGAVSSSTPSPMSYPSSRPESDFTLDLPRAEQLRIKMEKEKKFRQRCRVITTFLSLVFFLLTVMVVSLVLTRGKRMFGSMI
ncbi:uncharacterized protein LOC142238522 [Haematobia irritans]|uniref:uncharacterized protein LOC142238522 n=1 Tax=Haematobia irritans TaxID=7368 RepID=UPI003F4F71DA